MVNPLLWVDYYMTPILCLNGKIEQVRKNCAAEGMEFEYAFLLDALLEEQEQNITIDTTRIFFRTKKRAYAIIDAPGHKEFLKNMVTGAASASAALLLIDANEGVMDQSRRHAFLLSLLGVKQLVVLVNKMDLINHNQSTYEKIKTEYSAFLKSLGLTAVHFIPIAAKHGENVVQRSEKMSWWKGPTVAEALDNFKHEDDLTCFPYVCLFQTSIALIIDGLLLVVLKQAPFVLEMNSSSSRVDVEVR
jgi:bifunctional enzyme CysN/CysC